MKDKLIKMIKNPRVLLLLFVILIAVFAVNPRPFAKGVVVTSVSKNSSLYEQNIGVSDEVITQINSQPVENVEDYYEILSRFRYHRTYRNSSEAGRYNSSPHIY